MIAFGNLIRRALRNIPKTTIQWYKFKGKAINEIGIEVNTYEPSVEISQASCQPIENREYEALKLNLQKKYIRVFATADINVFESAGSPDKIEYDNHKYTVVSNQRWSPYDGWNELICVQDDTDITISSNS